MNLLFSRIHTFISISIRLHSVLRSHALRSMALTTSSTDSKKGVETESEKCKEKVEREPERATHTHTHTEREGMKEIQT